MYSIGYGTIALYLISVGFFLVGAFYKQEALIFMALAAVFFLIPSIVIAIMLKKRMNT